MKLSRAKQRASWLRARDRVLPYFDEPWRSLLAGMSTDDPMADTDWVSGAYENLDRPSKAVTVLLKIRDDKNWKAWQQAAKALPDSWDVSLEEHRLSRV